MAQRESSKARLTLGTATPGGGFPLYGAALIEAVREVDPSLTIEPRNTKGSTENVPLLRAGALDIALVQGEVAGETLSDPARAQGPLWIIAAMYATPGLFVTRGDSPDRAIADLRARSVAFGARGSGLVLLARAVLDGIDLDPERDFQAVYLDRAGDGPAMVLEGRVAALWGGGTGWPGFTAIAESPTGARFIAPSAQEIARRRADRLGGLLELDPRPRWPRGRPRLPSRPRASPRRGGPCAPPAASPRDHRRQYGRRRSADRPCSSRRAALPPRDRTFAIERKFGCLPHRP